MNRKLVGSTSIALALAAMAGAANAQTSAPAAAPEHTLTANVGIFSQYIFRGISQTAGKPALQGGFDYAHASRTTLVPTAPAASGRRSSNCMQPHDM